MAWLTTDEFRKQFNVNKAKAVSDEAVANCLDDAIDEIGKLVSDATLSLIDSTDTANASLISRLRRAQGYFARATFLLLESDRLKSMQDAASPAQGMTVVTTKFSPKEMEEARTGFVQKAISALSPYLLSAQASDEFGLEPGFAVGVTTTDYCKSTDFYSTRDDIFCR